MAKTKKLYDWIVAKPRASIPFRDFERVLIAFGFTHARTSGSHKAYHHAAINQALIIQPRGKDAKVMGRSKEGKPGTRKTRYGKSQKMRAGMAGS